MAKFVSIPVHGSNARWPVNPEKVMFIRPAGAQGSSIILIGDIAIATPLDADTAARELESV